MLGIREVFKRNNAFSLYDLYGNAKEQEPHGVMKFSMFVDLSLVIITTYSDATNKIVKIGLVLLT